MNQFFRSLFLGAGSLSKAAGTMQLFPLAKTIPKYADEDSNIIQSKQMIEDAWGDVGKELRNAFNSAKKEAM